MLVRVVTGFGVLAAGAGLAAAEEPANTATCAQVSAIDGWGVIDDKTALLVTPGGGRRYKVTFVGTCRDMKHANFAEIERRKSSGICLAPGDAIVFRRSHPNIRREEPAMEERRCTIKSIEAMPGETAPSEATPQ